MKENQEERKMEKQKETKNIKEKKEKWNEEIERKGTVKQQRYVERKRKCRNNVTRK
jgi:hypothetical protein